MDFLVINADGSTTLVDNEFTELMRKELQYRTRIAKDDQIVVHFSSRYDETRGWDEEENVSPHVDLVNPERSINNQRFPNENVIQMTNIRIQFDYPLEQPVIYDYAADTAEGFTRKHLAKCVADGYQRIYKEEDDFVAMQKHDAKYGFAYLWMLVAARLRLVESMPLEILYMIRDYCIVKEKRREMGLTAILLNRETTHGPHGIWGHSLGDLLLYRVSQVEVDLFDLGVDS